MTHREILTKAINKAIDGGWKPNFDIKRHRLTIGFKIEKPFEVSGGVWSVNDIIFSHDFAKAFFGVTVEEEYRCPNYKDDHGHDSRYSESLFCPHDGRKMALTKFEPYDQPWKDRLAEMVLADDPIQYLGEYL